MSLALYRWGSFVTRHAWWVIAGWVALLVATIVGVGVVGRAYDDAFTIPGSPSQEGMSVLTSQFPQAAGASAQLVFTAPDGASISAAPYADQVRSVLDTIASGPQIAAVSDPVSTDTPGVVSADGRSALAQVQFTVPNAAVDPASLDAVRAAAHSAAASEDGMTTLVGGTAFAPASEHNSLADLIGIAAAFLVLLVTFGSLRAAGMPLVTALVGVAITDCLIGMVSLVTPVNSTAPVLALMIGLAVGIDYALFVLSRHRKHLREGALPNESIAQTVGTAGSAVVFAGFTVIIALLGLTVANIPFLTVMGVCAAAGVAASVLVSLSLLPALAAVLGARLTPRPRRSPRRRRRPAARERRGFAERWVGAVTRSPVVTVVAVVVVLGTLSLPAFSLSLALNDNGTAPVGSEERATYDAVATLFGPGYNAPLLLVGDVITSTDPRGDVTAWAQDIAALPGVAAVTRATPNSGADTALVQVIPDGAQSSDETIALVNTLREQAPDLASAHSITDVQVTGQTAISIDVSQRLAGALVPFGFVVVGLSLVLLAIVFRSVLVPLKATIGYLLSIGVAFGVVTAVFTWGWGASLLGVADPGPVISFLPIIVMGVLFGLAMDYEVFLVSRMREEYTRTGDASGAIHRGFTASAPVVTAAGIIMVSVFVAFVPSGSATIKPIAVALAVGVFVDAFVVRMTLVPAVMAMLGARAWWLPSALQRRLPALDIEGESVELSARLRAEFGTPPLVLCDVVSDHDDDAPALAAVVAAGELVAISNLQAARQRGLALVISGRRPPVSGEVTVSGALGAAESGRLRRTVAVVDLGVQEDGDATVGAYIADRMRRLPSSGVGSSRRAGAVVAAGEGLLGAVPSSGDPSRGSALSLAVPLRRLSAVERVALECAVATAADARLLVVVNLDRCAASAQRHDVAATLVAWARGTQRGVLLMSAAVVRECDAFGIRHLAAPAPLSARAAVCASDLSLELQP